MATAMARLLKFKQTEANDMRAFEAPEIETLAFQVEDVITTSQDLEHDNGFVDFDDLRTLQW